MNKNNAAFSDTEFPYNLAQEVINAAYNKFYDELRPNFSHLTGLEKSRAINAAAREFFKEESPALECWLKYNGFFE